MMGGSDNAAASEAAALFGVPVEESAAIIAALGQDIDDEAIVLPADCEDVLRLFDAVRGQWRVGGMSGTAYALDLVAVDTAARWMGLTPSRRLLADIGIMEGAALAFFEEARR